jgi:threonine dehydrogenase-like Zn-dependent dehydrogenase
VRELMENREVGSTAVGSMLVLVGSDPEFIDDVHAICRKGGTAAYLGMMSLRKHDPKRSVPILSEILLQAEDNPRLVAAEELGRLGPEAKPAVPRLIQLLDDGNPQVRIGAAKALSQIDPERYPQKK